MRSCRRGRTATSTPTTKRIAFQITLSIRMTALPRSVIAMPPSRLPQAAADHRTHPDENEARHGPRDHPLRNGADMAEAEAPLIGGIASVADVRDDRVELTV